MPDVPSAPSWHADPYDPAQLRWWDGTQWTAHTAPGAPPESAPPAGSAPSVASAASAPVRRPSRRWWVIALIMLAVVVAGTLLAKASLVVLTLAVLLALGIAVFVFIRGGAPRLGLHSRLSGLLVVAVAALLLVGGGAANGAPRPSAVAGSAPTSPHAFAATTPTAKPKPTPRRTPTPTPTPTPTTTVVDVDVSSVIPFEQTTSDDPARDVGNNEIVTAGVNGTKVTTYHVTKVNGVETGRVLARETITIPPVTEVTARGTRQQPVTDPVPLTAQQPSGQCDPNYTGACVPIASDVDCAGGSGNGPAYVQGPVQVVGTDIYDLDRDGDGIGCDS